MAVLYLPPGLRVLHRCDLDELVERSSGLRHRDHHGEGGDSFIYCQEQTFYQNTYGLIMVSLGLVHGVFVANLCLVYGWYMVGLWLVYVWFIFG